MGTCLLHPFDLTAFCCRTYLSLSLSMFSLHNKSPRNPLKESWSTHNASRSFLRMAASPHPLGSAVQGGEVRVWDCSPYKCPRGCMVIFATQKVYHAGSRRYSRPGHISYGASDHSGPFSVTFQLDLGLFWVLGSGFKVDCLSRFQAVAYKRNFNCADMPHELHASKVNPSSLAREPLPWFWRCISFFI